MGVSWRDFRSPYDQRHGPIPPPAYTWELYNAQLREGRQSLRDLHTWRTGTRLDGRASKLNRDYEDRILNFWRPTKTQKEIDSSVCEEAGKAITHALTALHLVYGGHLKTGEAEVSNCWSCLGTISMESCSPPFRGRSTAMSSRSCGFCLSGWPTRRRGILRCSGQRPDVSSGGSTREGENSTGSPRMSGGRQPAGRRKQGGAMPNSPAVVFPVCPECGGEERVNDLNDRVLSTEKRLLASRPPLRLCETP